MASGNNSSTSISPRSRKSSTRNLTRMFSVKKVAVKNTHDSLRKILTKFNIPLVQKTFGKRIVRVCCRTVIQLENITVILQELIKSNLVEEIGMPLEHSYNLKSLVLFLKPSDIESSLKLDHVFKACSFGYHHLLLDVEYPTVAAKEILKKKTNPADDGNTYMTSTASTSANVTKSEESVSMESFNPIRAAQEEEEAGALIIKICNLTLHAMVLIGILMLISEVSTN